LSVCKSSTDNPDLITLFIKESERRNIKPMFVLANGLNILESLSVVYPAISDETIKSLERITPEGFKVACDNNYVNDKIASYVDINKAFYEESFAR
jgi:hypothetical protein